MSGVRAGPGLQMWDGTGPGGSRHTVVVADRDTLAAPSRVSLPAAEPAPGLILPDGAINWGCPCLGGMATGPCGNHFRDAFSCFHYSEADPKGSDCYEKFSVMQNCMSQYPDLYGKDDDDLAAALDEAAAAPAPTGATASTGAPAPTGATASTGAPAPTGATASTGAPAPTGATASTGAPAPTGATASTGAPAPTGATASTGAPAPTGATASTGAPAPTGAQTGAVGDT